MAANSVASHPGANGENSVVRWVASASGKYHVVAVFSADDPTTTDVSVVLNDMLPELFDAPVSISAQAQFDRVLNSFLVNILDFNVGFGTDGNYQSDSTGISVAIDQE